MRKEGLRESGESFYREKLEKMRKRITLTLFIEISVSRWIERCQKLSRIKIFIISYRGANERCQQQGYLDGSRSYQASIEHKKTSLMDRVAIEIESQESRWIEIAITTIEKGS